MEEILKQMFSEKLNRDLIYEEIIELSFAVKKLKNSPLGSNAQASDMLAQMAAYLASEIEKMPYFPRNRRLEQDG